MRTSKLLTLILVLSLSAVANAAPRVLTLRPVNLSNHWQIRGTVTTDGTIGTLTAANIIDWNIQVIQTTDMVWTQTDSNALNISGVSSDGTNLLVTTFPNAIQDGGTLYVGRGGGGGTIPTNAIVADFTQLSRNLGYNGGMAGYQDEIFGLNFIGLNQRNGRQYRAATLDPTKPNVFNIKVPRVSPAPYMITMFGTITTDGTLGPLQAANLIAWNITARMQDIATYTPATSAVLYMSNVSDDGTRMSVGRSGGQLVIGIGGARPTYVTLADFTDPKRPNGFANYYLGNFGLQGERSPLISSSEQAYVVTK